MNAYLQVLHPLIGFVRSDNFWWFWNIKGFQFVSLCVIQFLPLIEQVLIYSCFLHFAESAELHTFINAFFSYTSLYIQVFNTTRFLISLLTKIVSYWLRVRIYYAPHRTFACSKSTTETQEKCVKSVQS